MHGLCVYICYEPKRVDKYIAVLVVGCVGATSDSIIGAELLEMHLLQLYSETVDGALRLLIARLVVLYPPGLGRVEEEARPWGEDAASKAEVARAMRLLLMLLVAGTRGCRAKQGAAVHGDPPQGNRPRWFARAQGHCSIANG